MFTKSSASMAMKPICKAGSVPLSPAMHPDWYPSKVPSVGQTREHEPITLQLRNRTQAKAQHAIHA